jgi:acyl-CoA thioester hydrolase
MKVNPASTGTQRAHLYAVRVYYEDTDAGGVVYHASYLRFMERARTEALRAAGIAHAELARRFARMFVVRRLEIDYLRPARLDAEVTVRTEVAALRGAGLSLRQDVTLADGALAVAARVDLACIGLADQRARRIPPEWRAGLRAMMADGTDTGTENDEPRG